MQGSTLGITTGALTNGGRLQGDNGATLALSGTLTNSSGGEIVSRDGLTLTTPALFNYGLIQGGGETRVTASLQARNDGRLLSGAPDARHAAVHRHRLAAGHRPDTQCGKRH